MAAIGGLIYTAGGSNSRHHTVTDGQTSFKYDPVADTWTQIESIPRSDRRDARSCHQ